MATKKKGSGRITSINGGRKKAGSTAAAAPAGIPDLLMPEKLRNMNVTPNSLTKGIPQKKYLAWAFPALMEDLVNSIRRNLKTDKEQSQRLAAEMLGITGKAGGISINVNQTNNNKAEAASFARSAGPTSVDDMLRQLAAERENRALSGQQMRPMIEVTATPSGYEKGDEA